MKIFKDTVTLQSHGVTPTFLDITCSVKEAVSNSNIKEGVVHVISPHTTCSVFFEEFVHDTIEDGTEYLQIDLDNCLQKIIPNQFQMPPEGEYLYPGNAHFEDVESWTNAEEYLPGGDRRSLLNCDAHLKATLVGSSVTLEVADGKLGVGSTGYIYFVDFDRTRARERKCKIIVMGE